MTARLVLSDADRNPTYADWWSVTHILWGIVLIFFLDPFWALVLLVSWEPVEILIISPIMARFGIKFGHETLHNSLMDLVFNAIGVVAGMLLVPLIGPLLGVG